MADGAGKSPPRRGPASRGLGRRRATRTQEIPDQVFRQALDLLKARTEPTPEAYHVARATIRRLVTDTKIPQAVTLADRLLFLLSSDLSVGFLPGYATLDTDHIARIKSFLSGIERYVDDRPPKKPLNFLMQASPGSGKSHFIRCAAKKLSSLNIAAVTFNMANLQSNEDLCHPLDVARNHKVEDRIPLLFLDEFDSRPENASLLLPLLWDGELNLGQRQLKLGEVVIVLAGSDPKLPAVMKEARNMQASDPMREGDTPKLVDLLSRINGGDITIPPFVDAPERIDRRPDKVCLAVQRLLDRFGRSLKAVPLSLLRFVARAEFRYGARSISHLVNLIPREDRVSTLRSADLKLPVRDSKLLGDSSLAYHLIHPKQAEGVATLWKEAAASDALLSVSTHVTDSPALPDLIQLSAESALERIIEELNAHDP